MSPEVSALRTDRGLGITEEAEFFGSGPDRIFGLRYLPVSELPRLGVVMCGPVLAQFNAHYRKETLLARHLASRSIAVQRFHYRGVGNSDGAPGDLTVEVMLEDTRAATELLVGRSGCDQIAYLGVSLGSLPAALASQPAAPLVLDTPPVSGGQFFRKAFRSHTMAMMREGHGNPPTAEGLRERLRSTDDVSLLGFSLPRRFYDDVIGRTLVAEVGETPRPILIVEGNRAGVLGTDSAAIHDALTGMGFPVDSVITRKEDPLWYVDSSAPEGRPEVEEAIESIGQWLGRFAGGIEFGR